MEHAADPNFPYSKNDFGTRPRWIPKLSTINSQLPASPKVPPQVAEIIHRRGFFGYKKR